MRFQNTLLTVKEKLSLFLYTNLLANIADSLDGKKKSKLQFSIFPPFFEYAFPIDGYNKIGVIAPSYLSAEIKYNTDWNIGIGLKSGLLFGNIDQSKIDKHFKKKSFSETSDSLRGTFNESTAEPTENLYISGFIFFAQPIKRKFFIDLNIGVTLMELDNLLFGDHKNLAYLYYTNPGKEKSYYHLSYQYRHIPITLYDVGLSMNYMIGRFLGLTFYCNYRSANIGMKVETTSSQLIDSQWRDSILNEFKYKQSFSTINIGLGFFLRSGHK